MIEHAARKWITASELLTTQPCELIYAHAVSDGGKIQDTIIYDGENTNGEQIINLQRGAIGNITFSPKESVVCHHGLYIAIGSNTEGVFVQWRNLPRK